MNKTAEKKRPPLSTLYRLSPAGHIIAAVSAALNSFSKELLATHIRTCVADGIRQGDDAVIDELVTTLQKLMK